MEYELLRNVNTLFGSLVELADSREVGPSRALMQEELVGLTDSREVDT